MDQSFRLLRPLSPIEQAFTISNETFPLVVVCVLQLASGPEVDALKIALEQLQDRHPLLQAGITNIKGRLYFQVREPVPPVALTVTQRTGADRWRSVAEQALNTPFNTSGPLMKCWYLPNPGEAACELVVCFHHAIVDGVAARVLLHELLSLAGGLSLPPPTHSAVLPKFPPAYRNGNLAKRLLAFAGRQMKEEWQYQKTGISSPIPEDSRNAIISLRLSPALSRKLSVRVGREGLSLNAVLLAAITQCILRHRQAAKGRRLVRVISFADLRSFIIPPVSGRELGCYISMLRLSMPVAPDQSVWEFAAHIRRSIFQASRRGDVFLMSIISKFLIRLVFRLQNRRLGVAALSFIGKLDLDPWYGPVRLDHVRAYITNNRFGPEFSAFGKILFGSIGLDFTYLTSELEETQAEEVVKEIKAVLEKMADLP